MQTTAEAVTFSAAVEHLVSWLRRIRPPTGLSSSAFTTLDRLCASGPYRVSDLAALEQVTQPGMTALINRLSDDGLTRRAPDPADGRASLVTATDAGRSAVAAYRQARASAMSVYLHELSADDLRALDAAAPAIERLIALTLPADDRPVTTRTQTESSPVR